MSGIKDFSLGHPTLPLRALPSGLRTFRCFGQHRTYGDLCHAVDKQLRRFKLSGELPTCPFLFSKRLLVRPSQEVEIESSRVPRGLSRDLIICSNIFPPEQEPSTQASAASATSSSSSERPKLGIVLLNRSADDFGALSLHGIRVVVKDGSAQIFKVQDTKASADDGDEKTMLLQELILHSTRMSDNKLKRRCIKAQEMHARMTPLFNEGKVLIYIGSPEDLVEYLVSRLIIECELFSMINLTVDQCAFFVDKIASWLPFKIPPTIVVRAWRLVFLHDATHSTLCIRSMRSCVRHFPFSCLFMLLLGSPEGDLRRSLLLSLKERFQQNCRVVMSMTACDISAAQMLCFAVGSTALHSEKERLILSARGKEIWNELLARSVEEADEASHQCLPDSHQGGSPNESAEKPASFETKVASSPNSSPATRTGMVDTSQGSTASSSSAVSQATLLTVSETATTAPSAFSCRLLCFDVAPASSSSSSQNCGSPSPQSSSSAARTTASFQSSSITRIPMTRYRPHAVHPDRTELFSSTQSSDSAVQKTTPSPQLSASTGVASSGRTCVASMQMAADVQVGTSPTASLSSPIVVRISMSQPNQTDFASSSGVAISAGTSDSTLSAIPVASGSLTIASPLPAYVAQSTPSTSSNGVRGSEDSKVEVSVPPMPTPSLAPVPTIRQSQPFLSEQDMSDTHVPLYLIVCAPTLDNEITRPFSKSNLLAGLVPKYSIDAYPLTYLDLYPWEWRWTRKLAYYGAVRAERKQDEVCQDLLRVFQLHDYAVNFKGVYRVWLPLAASATMTIMKRLSQHSDQDMRWFCGGHEFDVASLGEASLETGLIKPTWVECFVPARELGLSVAFNEHFDADGVDSVQHASDCDFEVCSDSE